MAIQFCAVPLKLRKTCPSMEIPIAVSKNIKKGYSVVTLFYKINNDISIVNKELMKSTPTNRSIMIILMGTKPGYPRKKAFVHLTSDSIRLAAAIGAYGQ